MNTRPHLFKMFVEQSATKSVDDIIEWVEQRLECEAAVPDDDALLYFNGQRYVNIRKEEIVRNICATIIYQEWNFSGQSLLGEKRFVGILLKKLQSIVDLYGVRWGFKWATPFMDIIKVEQFKMRSVVSVK